MRFEVEPDLEYTRRLFRDLYIQRGYDSDQGKMWDWDPPVEATSSDSEGSASPAPANAAVSSSAAKAQIAPPPPPSGSLPMPLRSGNASGREGEAQTQRKAGDKDKDDDALLKPKLGEDVVDTAGARMESRPNSATIRTDGSAVAMELERLLLLYF